MAGRIRLTTRSRAGADAGMGLLDQPVWSYRVISVHRRRLGLERARADGDTGPEMNTQPRSRLLLDHKAPLSAFVVVALSSLGLLVTRAATDVGDDVPRAGDAPAAAQSEVTAAGTTTPAGGSSAGTSGTANPFAAPWQTVPYSWSDVPVAGGFGGAGSKSAVAGGSWVLGEILLSGHGATRGVTVPPPFVLVPPRSGDPVRSARSQAPGPGDGREPTGAPAAGATDSPNPSGNPEAPVASPTPDPPAASQSPEPPAASATPEPATPDTPAASPLPDWLQVSPTPEPSPTPEKPAASDGPADAASPSPDAATGS
jgi:hypothetical protein